MMQSATRVFLRAMAPMKQVTQMLKSCSQLWQKMQAILHGDSGLILHFSKWRCLARSYSLLLDSVRQQVEDHSNSPTTSVVPPSRKLLKLLDAVYEAMEAGARCLQDCISSCTGSSDHNSWLVGNVIKHGISTEIVHLHLHDLVWCCFLVKQAFGSDVLETMTVRLREIWEDEHEDQDLTSALDFLARLRADGAVLSETTSMAEFLSRRLAGASKLEGKGSVHPQALPEYLWVPPEELKTDPLKIIGDGAYGVVFEAEWRGGRFAVKTSCNSIEYQMEEGNSIECLMEREATILARIRHPNVIHLVCCTKLGEDSRRCALVMELMHKDLGSLLAQEKTRSIPHLVAVDLMLQVAKGMEYLHSLGIVHRDLKSSNILASFPTAKPCFNGKFPPVHLKIADFGMSKAKFPGSEFSTKEIGATRWRAPEVFEDECGEGSQSQYTGKADVYSFALICYEILTRKLPFEGIANKDVGKTVRMGERPELPMDCPLALKSYIQRCWHPDPSERPTFTQICRMLRYFKACLFDGDGLLAEGDFANRTCEIMETLLETRYPAQMYPRPTLRIALETNCFEIVVEGPEGNDGDDVIW